MPIVRQQNPWLEAAGATDNMVNTLARIMVTLPQLRNQAAQQQWNQSVQERQLQQDEALLQPRIGLMGAQQTAAQAQAGYDTQRTDASKGVMNAAEDVGLAEFGRAMVEQVPGYNPMKTSYMDASPENLAALMDAQRRMGLMRNAATSPTAAASMFRPTNIRHNAVNPLGDVMPMEQPAPPPIKLSPGQTLHDPVDFSVLASGADRPESAAGGITGPAALSFLSSMNYPMMQTEQPELAAGIAALAKLLTQRQLGTNAPAMMQPAAQGSATNRFKIKQVQ